MRTDIDFATLTADKPTWELLKRLNKAILSTSKNVEYRIFPIYIRYDEGERTIALLYYRGKKLLLGEIDLGLNIGDAKRPKSFDDGKRMKYPEINCSIKINTAESLRKEVLDAIKMTKI